MRPRTPLLFSLFARLLLPKPLSQSPQILNNMYTCSYSVRLNTYIVRQLKLPNVAYCLNLQCRCCGTPLRVSILPGYLFSYGSGYMYNPLAKKFIYSPRDHISLSTTPSTSLQINVEIYFYTMITGQSFLPIIWYTPTEHR
jgi:hypothetical protein